MKTDRPNLKELARKIIEQNESAKSEEQRLDESQARLENLRILVSIDPDTGSEHILISGTAEFDRAIVAGHAIYSPSDMRLYVKLTSEERRMVRELKAITQKGKR